MRYRHLLPDYFCGGLVPLKIWQMQPPLQGLVALHVPRQAGNKLAAFPSCNCRAERVPAHRTAIAITASDRFWILFFVA
jgi:hypothetical protein